MVEVVWDFIATREAEGSLSFVRATPSAALVSPGGHQLRWQALWAGPRRPRCLRAPSPACLASHSVNCQSPSVLQFTKKEAQSPLERICCWLSNATTAKSVNKGHARPTSRCWPRTLVTRHRKYLPQFFRNSFCQYKEETKTCHVGFLMLQTRLRGRHSHRLRVISALDAAVR